MSARSNLTARSEGNQQSGRMTDSPRDTTDKTRSPEPQSQKIEASESLLDMKDRVYNGYDLPNQSPQRYQRLIRMLIDDSNNYALNGDFEASERAYEAAQRLKASYKEEMKASIQYTQEAIIRQRLNNAEKDLSDLIKKTEVQEKNLKMRLQELMTNLKKKHENEARQLEEEWQGPYRVRRYNRSSSKLRNLRIQATKLLNIRKFDEMRAVEASADELERMETEEMMRHMATDYQAAVNSMLNRQMEEVDVLNKANEVRLGEYQAAKQLDISVAEKRIANLKRELADALDAERVWNLRGKKEYIKPHRPSTTTRSIRVTNPRKSVNVSDFNTLNLPNITCVVRTRKRL